jgi:polysaccharide pyruvyl transferase CsaB
MVFAQGIGPLRRPLALRATRDTLNRVALVTVRDQASADALRALGVSRPPIHVTADASLLMDAPSQSAPAEGECSLPPSPRIGVSLRSWGAATSGAWTAGLRRALEQACRARRASAVFAPMQHGDIELSSIMADHLAAPAVTCAAATPQQAMALIARMDVVVAMRLHALILACLMNVPCIGLAYDPKVPAFLNLVGQRCLPLDAEPQAVVDAIGLALDQRPQLAARIAAAMEPLRRAAARNVDLALTLLRAAS